MFTVENNQPVFDPMAEDELIDSLIVSLMVHGRVDPDEIPDHLNTRGGFWGDQLGVPVGSKLWTLEREARTDEVLEKAETYAMQALQWLGEKSSLEVKTSFHQEKMKLEVQTNEISIRLDDAKANA